MFGYLLQFQPSSPPNSFSWLSATCSNFKTVLPLCIYAECGRYVFLAISCGRRRRECEKCEKSVNKPIGRRIIWPVVFTVFYRKLIVRIKEVDSVIKCELFQCEYFYWLPNELLHHYHNRRTMRCSYIVYAFVFVHRNIY